MTMERTVSDKVVRRSDRRSRRSTRARDGAGHARAFAIIPAAVVAGGVAFASPVSAQEVERRAVPAGVTVPAEYQRALDRGWRSEDGSPGHSYWQNRAQYEIEAELERQAVAAATDPAAESEPAPDPAMDGLDAPRQRLLSPRIAALLLILIVFVVYLFRATLGSAFGF